MTQGTDLIAAERQRQLNAEGYTPEHDRGHSESLGWAGMAYAGAAVYVIRGEGDSPMSPAWRPWADVYWKPTGYPVRDLTKAGALIAAAIDAEIVARETSGVQANGVDRG